MEFPQQILDGDSLSQAIAISHPIKGDTKWLGELLPTLDTRWPIIITNHWGWQIDGIRKTFEDTDFDEIFFLNETMMVKDNSVWKIIFDAFTGQSVTCADKFQMYLAKYLRKYVEKTNFPKVSTRWEDVTRGEDEWNHQYMELDPDYIKLDPMEDVNPDFEHNFEYKFGRKNMVIENKYFKKWKSAWNISMIPNE